MRTMNQLIDHWRRNIGVECRTAREAKNMAADCSATLGSHAPAACKRLASVNINQRSAVKPEISLCFVVEGRGRTVRVPILGTSNLSEAAMQAAVKLAGKVMQKATEVSE